jgi:hypothetical protein
MSDNKNPPLSTAEIGLMNIGNMGGPTFADQLQALIVQLQINKTMGEILRDKPYNASPTSMAETPSPSPSRARNGWLPETPITSPPGQDIIKALCDVGLPHGPANRLREPKGRADKNE